MPVEESAGFAEEVEDFVHRKNLLFALVDPSEERVNTAAAVAHFPGEFVALAVQKNEGGKAVDIVFFCQSLIGGLGLWALLGTAREVDFHRNQIGFGEILERRLGEDILGYLRVSEISRDRVEDARNVLKDGDELSVMIINIDRKNRSINLSIKAAGLPGTSWFTKCYASRLSCLQSHPRPNTDKVPLQLSHQPEHGNNRFCGRVHLTATGWNTERLLDCN